MGTEEFWFTRTLSQIFLLVSARVERNERQDEESKAPKKKTAKEYMSMEEVMMLQDGFN